MKYTLFFFFAFLCIIELNALHLHPRKTIKKLEKPSSPIKKKIVEPIKKKVTEPIKKKIVEPIKTKVTEPIKKKIVDPIKKKIVDPIKKKIVDPIKKKITDPIKKKITDPIKKKITDPIKKKIFDPIKKITDPIKKKITDPIKKITDPIKKVTDPIKKITDPIRKVTGPIKKISDPIKKITDPIKKITDPIKIITDPIKEKIKDRIKEKMKEKAKDPKKWKVPDQIKDKLDSIKMKMKDKIKDKTPEQIKKELDSIRMKMKDRIKEKTLVPRKRKTNHPIITTTHIKNRTTYPIKGTLPRNKTKIINMKTTVPVRQASTPKNENKDNVKKVTDFVKSKLGCGYAYGSEGQTLSPDLLKYFKSKFKDNVKDSTKQWMNKECYDCSGLVMKALAQAGISVHHSAHYIWTEDMKKRGDIKDIPNDKLCLVFRKGKDGTMSHIGVYLGNGKVIEAKGADYGVVETNLSDGTWTNWGAPSGLE